MATSQVQLLRPGYRPDIDGLRAVAVLSVVAFHAFPGLIEGGFIGVDVFFVISGYLISTIIFENLDKGTFSFSGFYARRIKRIFPALLLVLVAVYIFGWYVLLTDEYRQLGKHIAARAGFLSYLVLWNEAGYFDTSAETKPLLHLWSLGIEEQFYIVWPLLLWIAWKKNFNLLIITLLVALASLYLNVTVIKKDTVAAFYSPQTRFWELLSGSLLAWIMLYGTGATNLFRNKIKEWFAPITSRETEVFAEYIVCNLTSLLGLSLLGYGFYRIDRDLQFPGAWSIVPVLGAVLLISAGSGCWINRVLLSNRLLVWFGLISFPLYLWHWPLLSFARILESGFPSINIRLALVLVSIALAWLTYSVVEKPIRFGRRTRFKVITLILLMVMTGYTGYKSYIGDTQRARDATDTSTIIASGFDGGASSSTINECGIEDITVKKLFARCIKDKRGSVKYALLGDSKAAALYTGLIRTSTNKGRWLFIGGNGPNGAPVPLISSDPVYSSFQHLTKAAVEAITENREIEVVVLVTAIRAIFSLDDGVRGGNMATYNHNYMTDLNQTQNYKGVFEGLDRTIYAFKKAGKKVILVTDNPALPRPEDCIGRQISAAGIVEDINAIRKECYVSITKHKELTRIYRRLLNELIEKYPNNVEVFDTANYLCEEVSGQCGPIHNGRLLYSYTDHISDYAAGRIGVALNAYLNN